MSGLDAIYGVTKNPLDDIYSSTPTPLTTPAARNNNPGNLKDPTTGQFRKFNSPQEGYAALVADVKTKQSGASSTGLNGNSTLGDFFSKYAPASDNNDPISYASNVAHRLNKRVTDPIGGIDSNDLASNIAQSEDGPYWASIKDTVNPQTKSSPTAPVPNSIDAIYGSQQPQQPQQPPLVNIPGMPYVSGAASAIANIPHSVGQAVSTLANSPLTNIPGINIPIPTALVGMLQQTSSGGLGGIAKSVWNSTVGFIQNQVQTLADFANKGGTITKDIASAIPGMDYYLLATQAKPMTDAERFQSGGQFAQTALAIGAGFAAGKVLGIAGKLAGGIEAVPDAISKLPVSAQAEIISQSQSNILGKAIGHGVMNGVAAGVTMSLAEAHADGQDVLNDAWNYGVAGALLGGAAGSIFGRSNIKTNVAAMKQTIARTMVQNFRGENAIDFSSDLTKGVDLVSAYQDNMNAGSAKVVTGMPTLTPENISDPTIGKYRNEDGSYNVLVQPKVSDEVTPTITSEQLKQFNSEGYISGETVTRNGSDFIYDGKSAASGLLKLRNIATDATIYAPESEVYRPNIFRLTPSDIESPITDYSQDQSRLLSSLSTADKATINNNVISSAIKNASKAENISQNLIANGYYADPSTNGYNIKSFSDPAINFPVENIDDIRSFITGQMRTPDAIDLVKQVQDKVAPNLAQLQTAGNTSLTVPTNGAVSLTRKIFDRINTIAHPVIPISNLIASITRQSINSDLYPEVLKVGQIYSKMSDAVKQVESLKDNYVSQAKATLGPIIDGDATTKNLIHQHMITFSPEEFNLDGLRGQAPSSASMNYAQQLIDAGTDSDDRFVANQFAINRARFAQQLSTGELTQDKFNVAMKSMSDRLNGGEPVTPEQMNAVNIIDKAHNDPASDHLETLVGADVLQHPERFLSQEDFASANNMTDEQVNASRQASLYYSALSKEFNIESPLVRYAPVMQQYMGGGLLDIDRMNAYRFAPPQETQFVHSLARLGFTNPDTMITDPAMLFTRYLNNGLRVKYLDPLLSEMKNQIQSINAANLSGDIPANALSNISQHLDNQVRGYSNPLDRLGETATPEQLGLLTGDVATAQRLSNLWTKWQAFKGIGFRPMIGMRHLGAVVQTVAMQFGAGFAKDFVSNMANGFQIGDQLQKSGVIPSTNLTNTLGAVRSTFNNPILQGAATVGGNVADASFKATGLPEVYKVMHATAYLTATQRIGSALMDYSRGDITDAAFSKQIGLDLYSPADQATFKQSIESGNYTQGTDFLARRTGEMAVGNFSRINNPMMYNNAAGRVIGQFGQWKLWELQNIEDALSNGDKLSRARRLTYLLGASTAAAGASTALGINLYNWALYDPKHFFDWLGDPTIPTLGGVVSGAVSNLLPNQSPALRLYSLMSDATSQSKSAKYSQYLMGQQLSPLPIPAEFNDAIEAVQRQAAGDPFSVWAYKLLGGQVDTQQYQRPDFNLFDY